MSETPSADLIVQVYEELDRRGFVLSCEMNDGRKECHLDFRRYKKKLGFERIWIEDGSRLVLTSELVPQARGLYSYFSVDKAQQLVARGWSLKTDFFIRGSGAPAVWPKKTKTPNYITAQRRCEDQESLESQGSRIISPATARFIEFWTAVQTSQRLRAYKDDSSFDELIKDIMAAGIIDQADKDGLDTEKKGKDTLNPIPYTRLRLDLPPALTATSDPTAFADWIEGELRNLFATLGFRIDDYLRRDMNTAGQSNAKAEDSLQQYIDILKYKGQIILQGPPGTGKTRLAKDIAEQILTGTVSHHKQAQSSNLNKDHRYKLVQFHPSYTYEDFVRGISVNTSEGTAQYEVVDRVFGEFAKKAKSNAGEDYVLIIDEINRANLSSVFGELIYALEYRTEPVASMYALQVEDPAGNNEEDNGANNKVKKKREDRNLELPENLYIIGTMNTADRSAGHIDYAIRRRFAFVNLRPTQLDPAIIHQGLFEQVRALFFKGKGEDRSEFLSEEFHPNDVALGHSYFLRTNSRSSGEKSNRQDVIKLKLDYEIKPILREYVRDGVLKESALAKIEELSA